MSGGVTINGTEGGAVWQRIAPSVERVPVGGIHV